MDITEKELKGLKDLQAKQDQTAMAAGVATIEYFERILGLVASVQQTRKQQRELGEMVLRSHGLDPDKNNYTIDMKTGEITHIVVDKNGQARYAPVGENSKLKNKPRKIS